jgi:hypothetical protein
MNLHHNFHRSNKGIGTVFGMVFFLLIVMIVFASFMIILNQNTGLQQTVLQTTQLAQNKANEQLTISQQPNTNLYTNIGAASVTVNCNLTNTGTLPVQLIRLWVEDLNNSVTGYLRILPTDTIYSLTPGESQLYSGNVPITIANSSDTFIFWFETTRGNQFTLQQLNGVSPISVYQSLSKVLGDFLPNYHSIQWSIVTKQGSNYVAGPWNDGWIINPNAGDFVAFRINLTYYGTNTMRVDNDTNIWLENFPGSVYDVGYQEDELPLLYISNYTENTHYLSIYTGHEMTVNPSPSGTNLTLYFATMQTADNDGLPINPQTPSGYELEDIEPTVIMTATIYGMSPSTYAQSFLLYAAQSRTLGIDATPPYGPVGTTESVDGTTFQARTTISLFYDSTQITIPTTTTNGAGNFGPVTFIIPPSTAGAHTITAVDSSPSHNTAIAPFTVIPTITLSQTQGPRNTPVTVTGTGFAANSNVGITFGGNTVTTTPAIVTTDGFGSFTASFLVPASVAGATPVVATDASGNTDSANFGVTVSSISLAPPSAKVGVTVTVSGSNFIPNSPITIALDGTQVATTTATATGAIPGGVAFTVPAAPAGAHTVTATDSTNNIATATLTITPNTLLTPTSGPYGTSVSITGQGFAASSTITVTFAGTQVATSPTTLQTDNSGTFSGSFIVPSSSARAQQVISSDGTNSYTGTFTVITRAITLNPTSGSNGTTVTVTGSNFEPTQVISLNFDATPLTTFPTTVISSGTGAFSCTFAVPNSANSGHTVYAGDTVPNAASATFGVVGSSLSLNPTNGPIGTRVTVTGSNFLPTSPLNVTYDGATVATSTSTATGTIPGGVNFLVPLSTFGSHVVKVTDGYGNFATATYTVSSSITLNPVTGLIGTTVTATGQGFAASSTIAVTFAGSGLTTAPTSVQSDTFGSFTCTFAVPTSTGGAKTVAATDASAHTATATFTVTAPTLTLNPTTGPVSTSVTMTGSNFVPNSAVTVTFGGNTLTTNPVSITASGTGTFSATFNVPASSTGGKAVTATDAATNSGSATFTVTTPSIALSPNNGPVTTSVTVSGSNFVPSSALTVTYDGVTVGASTSTASGALPTGVTFPVPSSTFGSHTVTVTDSSGNNAGALFSVTASISLSPVNGVVGTSVTVTGRGFAGSSTITLSFNSVGVTTSPTPVQADTFGTFSCSFTVPSSTTGAKTVQASDGTHPATATFTVNPGPLDHFTVTSGGGSIGAQTVYTPFSITVTAYDANNNVKTDYAGPATLSDLASAISPTSTGTFTNGVATLSVTISHSYTNDMITATDSGKTGQSNAFNVNLRSLALDGSTSNTGTNTISLTLTTANPNDVLYLSITEQNSVSVTSVTSAGLTWNLRGTATNAGGTVKVETWYAIRPTSGSTTITIALNSGSYGNAAVAFGVSGADIANPFDGAYASGTGSGTSASTSKTTNNANDFVIGAIAIDNTPTVTAGTNFNIIATRANSNLRENSAEYRVVSATGTYATSFTLAQTNSWAMIVDAIRQAS